MEARDISNEGYFAGRDFETNQPYFGSRREPVDVVNHVYEMFKTPEEPTTFAVMEDKPGNETYH